MTAEEENACGNLERIDNTRDFFDDASSVFADACGSAAGNAAALGCAIVGGVILVSAGIFEGTVRTADALGAYDACPNR